MITIGPRSYIRVTLLTMILTVVGALALGLEVGSVLRAGLVGLAVAVASLLIVLRAAPDLVPYGLSVIWLTAGVLVVERAMAAGIGGWVAVGGWLVANLVATAVYGLTFGARRMLAAARRERAFAVSEHERFIAERRDRARRAGLTYEQAAPALAEGFGRVEQQVPEDFVSDEGDRAPGIAAATREAPRAERMRVVLEHAAGLQAEAVVHARIMGLPVVAFDLEVLDHDTLLDRDQVGFASDWNVAAELAKSYLTVWMVRLPVALPYAASAFAVEQARTMAGAGARGATGRSATASRGAGWRLEVRQGFSTWVRDESSWSSGDDRDGGPRPSPELLTGDEQLARRLLSAPELRAAALADDAPPFFVDGDRLVASTLSTHGIAAADVEQGMSYVAGLAAAVPWGELERDHALPPDAGRPRPRRFHRTYRRGSTLVLERWVERNAGRSALRIHERAEVAVWTRTS